MAKTQDNVEEQASLYRPPAELELAVREVIEVQLRLQDLAAERKELSMERQTAEADRELLRQDRELTKMPRGEQARMAVDRLERMIDKLSSKMDEDPRFIPDEKLLEAYRIGGRQVGLLIRRSETIDRMLPIAAEAAGTEPLFAVSRHFKVDVDEMFAWALYTFSIEYFRAQATERLEQVQDRLAQSGESGEKKRSGLMGLLGRSETVDVDERKDWESEVVIFQRYIEACSRELDAIERDSVEAFWDGYGKLAQLLVSGKLDVKHMPFVRAALRWGLIGRSAWFARPELIQQVLVSCKQDVITDLPLSTTATHVLYADEYIDLVAKGQVPPSVDEDLELNQRNSPEWRRDKAWRTIVYCKQRLALLEEVRHRLATTVKKLASDAEMIQKKLKDSQDAEATVVAKVKQILQENRVVHSRLTQSLEHLQKQHIDRTKARMNDAQERQDRPLRSPELALKEAIAMRRVSRLTAKLKDPFLPLMFRDGFKPESQMVNDRKRLAEMLADMEERDPILFKEELIKHKKLERRVYLRCSPCVVITPSSGFMGFSWNPRTGGDLGRVVVPGYTPRSGILESLLYTMFADFRWDTAKDAAGMDLMNSDTICAAYASVRWEYRKRSRGARERAAIYKEQTDRENFRRHYQLYVASAKDGGKQLFFKCYEAYLAFLKYFVLPEGVKKLERA